MSSTTARPVQPKPVNFCNKTRPADPRDQHIGNISTYGTGSYEKCYFIVKKESIEPLLECPATRSWEAKVDMDLVWKICSAFDATLPIIKNNYENAVVGELARLVHSTSLVIIGMRSWVSDSSYGF